MKEIKEKSRANSSIPLRSKSPKTGSSSDIGRKGLRALLSTFKAKDEGPSGV